MARNFLDGTRWQRQSTWLQASLVLLCAASTAHARAFRVSQIPNGSVNGCANCHVNPAGGGPRNAFGTTVETSFLSTPGPAGNVLWGPALAAIDSDGDGRTNGTELLDPAGTWVIGQPNPGQPTFVRNPGLVDAPTAVPALPSGAFALLVVGFGAIGASRLRRNFASGQSAARRG